MQIIQMTFNVSGRIKYSTWMLLSDGNEQIIDTYSNEVTFQMHYDN